MAILLSCLGKTTEPETENNPTQVNIRVDNLLVDRIGFDEEKVIDTIVADLGDWTDERKLEGSPDIDPKECAHDYFDGITFIVGQILSGNKETEVYHQQRACEICGILQVKIDSFVIKQTIRKKTEFEKYFNRLRVE